VSQKKITVSTKLQIILFTALLLFIVPPDSADSVGTTLGGIVKLVTNESDSLDPNIAVSGNNIYVAYVDTDSVNGDTDVFFALSTDGGTSFGTPYIIDPHITDNILLEGVVTTAANNQSVQIAASGNNVYVAWEENDPDDADTDVYIAVNTNSGADGSWTVTNLSDSIGIGASTTPKLSVSGANIYVVWRDDANAETNIYINRSKDSGASFTGTTKLTTTTGANSPEVTSTGSSVYAIWRDTNGNAPVSFKGSNDNGDTFAAIALLSTSANAKSGLSLAVSGTTVHSVWIEGTANDVLYRGVTDNENGTFTLVPLASIITVRDGSTAILETAIIASGTSVHVAWRETDGGDLEIYHSRSTDNGATFSARVNISDDAGISNTPQLGITGTNFYIAWGVFAGGDQDLFIKTSIDDGATFGARQTIQDHGANASFVKMAVASGLVFLVWEDDIDDAGTDSDVFFISGTTTDTDVDFDSADYRLTETATIDVTAPNSNTNDGVQESITVNVTSDAVGSTAISFLATETTVSSGIFRGTITFNESSSNDSTDTINAIPGTIITAEFNTQTNTANIFARTVNIIANSYNLDLTVRVEVTDQNSNIDPATAETINVTVTSRDAQLTDSNPITLLLTENAVNSGVFGGLTDAELRFMNGFDAIPIGRLITITQDDATKDTTGEPDTTTVTISTDTEPAATTITLRETGRSTDVFTGIFGFTTGETISDLKKASAGDFFTIDGTFDLKGQIAGGSDNSKRAMRTNVAEGSPDEITATFGASSDTAAVTFAGGEGGSGGGGSVRPTVVLNAILGITGGGNIDRAPPLSSLDKISERKDINVPDHIKEILKEFDPKIPIAPLENEEFNLPLKINQKAYPLGSNENTIQTETINIGEPVRFEMTFYEDTVLMHASLYLNIRDNQRADQSDTQILFNKFKPLEIIDKNSFFKDVSVEIIEAGDGIKIAVFEITFAKEMETSDLIYKSWDFKKRGTEIMVHDAIQIPPIIDDIPIEDIPDEKPTQETVETTEEKPVPEWVKSNAKWWSEGGIDDKTFTNGIGFLISEKIIDIPVDTNVSEIKDTNIKILEEETAEVKVPQWIKANAEWWANDQIDEGTFLSGIEYLVKHGIITVT